MTMQNSVSVGDSLWREPDIGQAAPDFSLPAATRETHTLSDYRRRRKIVLAFYVLDFTGG